jgi:Uma2 family endonuclease
MVASRVPSLSPEEYLAWEEKAEVRHEYIDGEIFAMSGSSDDHATIVGNTLIALKPFVRGAGCRIYPQDVKAKIHDQSRYYYPSIGARSLRIIADRNRWRNICWWHRIGFRWMCFGGMQRASGSLRDMGRGMRWNW